MSVVYFLEEQAAEELRQIEQLNDKIASTEASLARDRERLAELEVRLVEIRMAANILRDVNLRVERRPGGIHVEVDPPTRERS